MEVSGVERSDIVEVNNVVEVNGVMTGMLNGSEWCGSKWYHDGNAKWK